MIPLGIRLTQDIHIFSGQDGTWIRTIETPWLHWNGSSSIGVADVDLDGQAEIILASAHPNNDSSTQRYLFCYEADGTLKWRSDTQYGYDEYQWGGSPSFADFNQDGLPEVYIYNQIFNAQTGVKLVEGGIHNNKGIGLAWEGSPATTFVVDILPDIPGMELVAGNQVYAVNITDITHSTNNTMLVERSFSAPWAGDGFTSVADLDNDGDLDIIVTKQYTITRAVIFVWEGESDNLVGEFGRTYVSYSGFFNVRFGVPIVGDIDGDKQPEIVFSTRYNLRAVELDSNKILLDKWQLGTSDESGATGITMFDFNQDGIVEIIYRDETTLRILDGNTGYNSPRNYATFFCASGTGIEMPVVADVDNDGQAEIIVTCGADNIFKGNIQAYGTGGDPWAPARKVWNQYTYQPVVINDDLTVPRTQQNHAFTIPTTRCGFNGINRPLNNFLTQATCLDREGCTLNPVPDVTLTIDSLIRKDSEVIIDFNLINNGSNVFPKGSPISFYDNDPTIVPCNLVGTYKLGEDLYIDSTLYLETSYPVSNFIEGITSMTGVVNDPGTSRENLPYDLVRDFPLSGIAECNYANNIGVPLGMALNLDYPSQEDSLLNNIEEQIFIYPNPANDWLKINSSLKDLK